MNEGVTMKMKKVSALFVCIIVSLFCFISCGSAKIPDIANVEEMSAKSLISSMDLIPAIVYEHNDNTAEGCVIKTEPESGISVPKQSIVTIYISKGPELKVPDVSNVDEETAKKVLTSNQLIPSISYEYSDTVIVGNVTRTEPTIGTVVEPNSKITVFLSYGPSHIKAKHVSVDGISVLGMETCNVYREGDKLFIECIDFWCSFYEESSWDDPNNTGYIQGIASLTEDFYNFVPATGKYQNKTWYFDRYEPGTQTFTLEVSLIDLDVDKPNLIYIQLYYNSHEIAHFVLKISW